MYFCQSCERKVEDDHKCPHANPDDEVLRPKKKPEPVVEKPPKETKPKSDSGPPKPMTLFEILNN